MKIEFDDGSFLEVVQNGDKTHIVMCGFKTDKQLTMSVSDLNKDQLKQLVEFLSTLSV